MLAAPMANKNGAPFRLRHFFYLLLQISHPLQEVNNYSQPVGAL
jgi:hypothetical protein